tara:strand:- start:1157 stop:1621 length:465 start_codon:yes stop_codon:yes gene_type:complete
MSKIQDSTILRNNIKEHLKLIGYPKELISKLEHHCWNLNCEKYIHYKKENNITEMTYADLLDFIDRKYLKGFHLTDCAHIVSKKLCLEDGFKDMMNEYLNGIFLCKECHDKYDNWNAGAGKNIKRARTNENPVSGRHIILNILEMKKKSLEFFK